MTHSFGRRHFLKLTVGVLFTVFMTTRDRKKPEREYTPDSGDETFVVWKGWVLRKTDLKHIA